jgi:2-oxoglutarate dehydrogenase E2 component (dihydrolipoamide succinyltransferase)
MPTKVIMPQLGESVVEGTITKWLKSKGDNVEEYEPLLEVNTDKVDSEIPSPTTGVLLATLVNEGITVQAGDTLAWIGESGEEIPDSDELVESSTMVTLEDQLSEKEEIIIQATSEESISTPTPTLAPGRDRDLGFISPVVARIASENNVDLFQVTGTGKNGRITKKDILAYIEGRTLPVPLIPKDVPPVQVTTQPLETKLPGEVIPLNPVRKAIANHMVMSKHTSPHVTTAMEVDLNQVVAHRNENKVPFAQIGVKLTFTAYFIAATVSALKAYPIVNSSWSDEGIVYHQNINIGMATSLGEEGLIVPVIKNADNLSLIGIAKLVNDLANRARVKNLKPDEVRDGTFTITNHGVSGSLFATPIINQPQCGILGVGAIQKRVVVISDDNQGDTIAIRPMVYLTLTFDHRILDGAIADYFLYRVVESLQNWS